MTRIEAIKWVTKMINDMDYDQSMTILIHGKDGKLLVDNAFKYLTDNWGMPVKISGKIK